MTPDTINSEFVQQVEDSHAAIRALLAARQGRRPHGDEYLESEQALIAGHRFHPMPKARAGEPSSWLAFAPEAHASFEMHHLAVREDLIDEAELGDGGELIRLDRMNSELPEGYRLLPTHPWQLELLGEHPRLQAALQKREILDLGPSAPLVFPTSSVRTVYEPSADRFYKFSLNVRLTNCWRKHAWYELIGSIALSRLLSSVFIELDRLHFGATLLLEPAYRTVDLNDRSLTEGLAVVIREGVEGKVRPGVTPLLAAAIADQHQASRAAIANLLERGDRCFGHALKWWEAYISRLIPPVLHAYFGHGVVLEPHLQNVLVGVTADGMPVQMIFRDLEGVKLLPEQHSAILDELPPRVRAALSYSPEQGWKRVVYCLVVNHLAELAAAMNEVQPGIERRLWSVAREHFLECANYYDWPFQLRELLAGVPLPAKANLRTRFLQAADRDATYVSVANPLGDRSFSS